MSKPPIFKFVLAVEPTKYKNFSAASTSNLPASSEVVALSSFELSNKAPPEG